MGDKSDKKAFKDALTGPLLELEPFDADEETLLELRNFDPEIIMELLVEAASSKNTTPDEFHKDMKNLLTLDCNVKKISDEDSVVLNQLKQKYNVEESGKYSVDITFQRLRDMFPHHLIAELTHNRKLVKTVPAVFQYAVFGGFIPAEPSLSEDVKKVILTIHLYFLDYFRESESRPFRTQQVLLKRFITKTCMLSDERRMRILVVKDVITPRGGITSTTQKAFEYVKSISGDLESRIDWDLFF